MRSSLLSITLILTSCAHRAATPLPQPSSIPVVGLIQPGEVVPEAPVANRAAHEAFAKRRILLTNKYERKLLDANERADKADARAEETAKSAAKEKWLATWGFPLGGLAGTFLTAVSVVLGLVLAR